MFTGIYQRLRNKYLMSPLKINEIELEMAKELPFTVRWRMLDTQRDIHFQKETIIFFEEFLKKPDLSDLARNNAIDILEVDRKILKALLKRADNL